MRIIKTMRFVGALALVATIGGVLWGKGKIVTDVNAGVNGSFEITKGELPVNWIFYTPDTVSSGDFDIATDREYSKEGKQSLKFVVRKCSNKGGRLSPGFTQEFKAVPGETYVVSFWAKNAGCEFIAKAGGVSAFRGEYKTIVKSRERFETWRQFSAVVTIPKGMSSLRWELNVLRPGTFWIDDLKIKRVRNGDNAPVAVAR